MKRKDHANFFFEIDSLSPSSSKKRTLWKATEKARVQAIKSMQERERELPFFSITCFHVLPFLFLVSLLLNILSLSFPLATMGREIPTEEERAREKKRS
jgi:hypothetical protein